MAAKRFTRTAIDWAAFVERIPPTEKTKFHLFKSKVDGYTKAVMNLPDKAPTIDFASYRTRLPNPAMVDEFEKQYNAIKVPYPADKLTPLIDAQEKQIDAKLVELREIAELNCKYYNKSLQWWKDMMPFDQMSMDDFYDYFPDPKYDIYKTPSFWPHTEPARPVFPYLEKKEHH